MSEFKKVEKKDRPYVVVPYSNEWTKKYEQEQKIIAGIFGKKALRIEHIGSTSVKKMWAKPQIDILVVVDDLHTADGLIAQMESKGYVYQEDFNKYHERYFTRDAPSGERLVSIHVMQPENSQTLSHIYLREYLRQHPQERNLYSQVKREAYESGVGRVEYPRRKREVLNAILKRARKWHDENRIKRSS